MPSDELLARLMETFLEELEERTRSMSALLLALEHRPGEAEDLLELYRAAHNVKGAARAVGATEVQETCHRLETLFAGVRDAGRSLSAAEIDEALRLVDLLEALGRELRGEGAPPALPAEAPAREREETTPASVRVRTERIDAIVRGTGELLGALGRGAQRIDEAKELLDLTEILRARLSAEGRSSSPLRTTVEELARAARRVYASLRDDRWALERVLVPLADEARRARMVPVAEAFEGLERATRDLARDTGKEVELSLEGSLVEMDRGVVEGLKAPLLHLVRNAVDHGIEPPDARAAVGKPRVGTVRVAALLRGGSVELYVEDDGRGLDFDRLRAKARAQGLAVPDDPRELVFLPGLSTAQQVTDISGRGIGLDVVRQALGALRGHIDVESEQGRLTRFRLLVPLTLTIVRVLLVRVGGHTYAVPVSGVGTLARPRIEDLVEMDGGQGLQLEGQLVPLVRLATLLDVPSASEPPAGRGDRLAVVVLEVADRRLGVVVDTFLAEEEVLLRPLGPRLAGLSHVEAAALVEPDVPTPVLSPGSLLDAGTGRRREPPLFAKAPAPSAQKRILLVDDSLTTRALEQSILESAGYDVVVAGDGAEAWELLRETPIDLLVADIEMPRMDGIELTRAVRSSPRLARLPIVLLTALGSEEDQARGLEAGASAYLVKSAFEQTALLEAIARLL